MPRCGSCRQHGSAYAAVVPRAAKAVIQATANAHLIPHLPCPCHVLKNVSDPVQAFQEIGLADYHASDLQGPSSEAEKNSLTWYISTKNKTIGVKFFSCGWQVGGIPRPAPNLHWCAAISCIQAPYLFAPTAHLLWVGQCPYRHEYYTERSIAAVYCN